MIEDYKIIVKAVEECVSDPSAKNSDALLSDIVRERDFLEETIARVDAEDGETQEWIRLLAILKEAEHSLKAQKEELMHSGFTTGVIEQFIATWPFSHDDIYEPPKLAEFLLMLFAAKRRRDYVIADQREQFTRKCKEFGRSCAVRWYWADTLRSIGPQLVRTIGKFVKWGAIIDWVRWKVGL